MPKYKVELLLSAWQDIDSIFAHYASLAGTASAVRITDKILTTVEGLAEFPYMGALHPDPVLALQEYRKILCEDYVCVYRVIDQTVFIYRIVNGRTDYPQLFK